MARSRRGFQLQQFLPGNVVPSTASKPTGVVPQQPGSAFALNDPPFSAQAPAAQIAPVKQVYNAAGGYASHTPLLGASSASSANQLSKFDQLVAAINKGGLGDTLKKYGLGSSAADTNWKVLFGYKGAGSQDVLAQAMKNLGITKPKPTLGIGAGNAYSQDWMKQMGLI